MDHYHWIQWTVISWCLTKSSSQPDQKFEMAITVGQFKILVYTVFDWLNHIEWSLKKNAIISDQYECYQDKKEITFEILSLCI